MTPSRLVKCAAVAPGAQAGTVTLDAQRPPASLTAAFRIVNGNSGRDLAEVADVDEMAGNGGGGGHGR